MFNQPDMRDEICGLQTIARQFADRPTCAQLSCRIVNSQTSQHAEMLNGKFGVHNCFNCDFSGRQHNLYNVSCQ